MKRPANLNASNVQFNLPLPEMTAAVLPDDKERELVTVAVGKGAKMAGRRAPVRWLRDGQLPRQRGRAYRRLCFSRAGFPTLSLSQRGRICL